MKCLYVGDPHIKPNNIDEADRLMDFVNDLALSKKVDRITILGDLMHTHAVVRLEVLEFWDQWLDTLSEVQDLVVLVGNHDQSGNFSSDNNSLRVFQRMKKKTLHIVEYPKVIGSFGYISYIHDRDKFVEIANNLIDNYGAKIIICHQTFDGAKYESGIYAPDGINPDLIKAPLIISGHIHSRQAFGKVIFPGTPKWDSASDANEQKGVWIFEHDDLTGAILNTEFFSTENVVTPIIRLTWKEGEEMPTFPENAKTAIELVGSSSWIDKQKPLLKGKASISTKITDRVTAETRKTGTNFEDFIKNLYSTSMNKEHLLKWMKEMGLV